MTKAMPSRGPRLGTWLTVLASGAAIACALWLLWFFFWRIPAVNRTHPPGVRSVTTLRPEFTGAPDGVVALQDGGAFYFDGGNSSSSDGTGVLAGTATRADELREYLIPTKGEIQSVAIGPDGTLWATTILDNPTWPPVEHGTIVRITGNVMTTAFSIPKHLGYASALVAAPDGTFWFALADAHAVGHATRRGDTRVTILPRPIKPDTLALATNGNLYVAERGRPIIVRLSPQGKVLTLTSHHNVGALAAGPANEVWFTEEHSNRLGRITPSARIEEVETGSYMDTSAPIAVSNDSVWFAAADGVGRLSLRDRTSVAISLPNRPRSITSLAVSKTGVIWLTEALSDGRCVAECGAIVRITP